MACSGNQKNKAFYNSGGHFDIFREGGESLVKAKSYIVTGT